MDEPTAEVLFIGGRSGVGKSSAALALSRLLADADIAHVVIEGDNLGHAHPEPWKSGLPLTEENLAAVWRNYWVAGYRRLIYTNTVSVIELDKLSAAVGVGASGAAVHSIGALLRCSDESARTRLDSREVGLSLDEHVERSDRAASLLDRSALASVHRIDTDGLTAEQVAVDLLATTGWV